MKIPHIFSLLTPPLFVSLYRRVFVSWASEVPRSKGNYLEGPYASWSDAAAVSGGYDNEAILKKTRSALLQVRDGVAAYERDSVLFDEVQYSWPLLAGLLWVAAKHQGHLRVLDYGGALGSSYFQNRVFLKGLCETIWSVVEQPKHVAVGNVDFCNDALRFFDSASAVIADNQPNVIILSGVLQYLQDPYMVLNQLLSLGCDHIIIDRTPFWDGYSDELCVQHVPESIYPASYPSWIFSTTRFRGHFPPDWHFKAHFQNQDRIPGPFKLSYRGMIIAKE